jgi:hypothetical protein
MALEHHHSHRDDFSKVIIDIIPCVFLPIRESDYGQARLQDTLGKLTSLGNPVPAYPVKVLN